ncbi:MAG: hypothetical protein IKO53_04990 [Lachnospiraceae bacterium]|nr:hypothetical protein [Lachnospiraceae bacterium]
MEVFKLFGSIFIDNEAANKSLDSTGDKAKGAGSKIASGLGSAMKTAAAVGTAVVGATTAVVKGATDLARSTATAADEVDKASQKMGVSAEEYQELAHAADLCGTNMGTMQTAQKKLLAAGSDLSLTDALMQCADAEDSVAAASDLFGEKVAMELAPMLNQGSEGIKAMMQEADDLGIVMSGDTVKAGAALTDSFTKLEKTAGAVKNQLGAALMPIINQLVDMLIGAMPTIMGLIDQLTPIITQMFDIIMPLLETVIKDILPVAFDLISTLLPVISEIITAVLPIVIQLLQQLLPPFVQIVKQVLPLVISLIKPLLPLIQPILNLLTPLLNMIMSLIPPLINIINQVLPPIISLLTTVLKSILPPLQTAFNAVATVITKVFQSALSGLKPIIENVKGYFQGIIDFVTGVFSGNWTKAWNGIKTIFSNIVSGFGNIIKYPINAIITGINAFINGLNKLKIPDWVPGVGGKGLNIPTIPKLRRGIDYVPYDDYPAYLHEGERVLTREENAALSSAASSSDIAELLENILNLLSGLSSDVVKELIAAMNGMKISYNDRELARLIEEHS